MADMNRNIIDKCIKILKTSKSDNELLAALLTVSKVAKPKECSDDVLRQLFDAIGYKFLVRLLKTGERNNNPDENTAVAFQKIAVNIFSCFCLLDGVIQEPGFGEILHHIMLILALKSTTDDSNELLLDCYDCLMRISTLPEGLTILTKHDCVLHLCHAIIEKCHCSEKAFELLLYICQTCGGRTWRNRSAELKDLIQHLTSEIECDQTDRKFELCGSLGTIVLSSPLGELLTSDYESWRAVIAKLSFDLLRNKLGQQQRACVLGLCSALVEHCGVTWMLDYDTKFVLILVHLSCIEIRMALDTEDIIKIDGSGSLLVVCYSILEKIIEYMTAGPSLQLKGTQVTQLHAAMVGAFNAVIHFLNRMAEHPDHQNVMPVVIASIRILGSWLAEETSALRDEVITILPFLLQTSWTSLQACQKSIGESSDNTKQAHPSENLLSENSSVQMEVAGQLVPTSTLIKNRNLHEFISIEVLQFLMPGLCHLTAEDIPRKILLEHNLLELLNEYFVYQMNRLEGKRRGESGKEPEIALVTLCGVAMNITVLEPDTVSSHPAFREILDLTVEKLPVIYAKDNTCMSLLYNIMVIGLMIIQQRPNTEYTGDILEKFLTTSIGLLKSVHSLSKQSTLVYHSQWEDITDIWALGMQVLSACFKLFPRLPDLVLDSDWLPKICTLLLEVKGGVPEILYVSYCEMITSIVSTKWEAKQVIIKAGGVQVARNYKMENLSQLLKI